VSAPRALVAFLLTATLTACSQDGPSTGSDTALTVTGSAGAPPSAAVSLASASYQTALGVGDETPVTNGDPAAVLIGMYALYISSNADCSSATLVQDYGEAGEVKDLAQNPVLFSADAAEGTYNCVLMRMSDVIGFRSESSFGTCEADVDYQQDIYREGESDWKDVDLNPIVGTGTDEAPADDRVTVVMTTNPQAALAVGFSEGQIVTLGSSLVVPAQSTFYWNGDGSVTTEDGRPCGLEPGQPVFE
jgi:hypothetical protein